MNHPSISIANATALQSAGMRMFAMDRPGGAGIDRGVLHFT